MTAQSYAAPPQTKETRAFIPASSERQRALDELEQRYPGLWRAGQLGRAANLPVWPTGYPDLSAELPGGGWPVGALTELMHADDGMGELRLLRPALQSLTAAGRRLVLVGPPHPPNAAGLAAWGLPQRQVFWVRTVTTGKARRQADILWAAEQVLRSHAFGGVLVWLPTARPEAIRRLQVLAQAGEAVVWVSRPATAVRESSAAVLRLLLSPLPGNGLSIVFHKRRGPVREGALELRLAAMPAVPGDMRERMPQRSEDPTLADPMRNLSHATYPSLQPVVPVNPGVEGEPDHVVLDRGASAAPVAGRAAAELA